MADSLRKRECFQKEKYQNKLHSPTLLLSRLRGAALYKHQNVQLQREKLRDLISQQRIRAVAKLKFKKKNVSLEERIANMDKFALHR